MLAYVFWHWPLPGVEGSRYESELAAFHDVLAELAPEGFLGSMIFRHGGAPWTHGAGDAYEDWYLVGSSAGLDTLNDAAISGARRLPHDRVARSADGGAGGLYRLRQGSALAVGDAHWFAKPAGMPYAELYELLAPVVASVEGALWERRMVLGPAPEFCLVSEHPVSLPASIDAMKVERAALRARGERTAIR
jgi:hypothetical protein